MTQLISIDILQEDIDNGGKLASNDPIALAFKRHFGPESAVWVDAWGKFVYVGSKRYEPVDDHEQLRIEIFLARHADWRSKPSCKPMSLSFRVSNANV